MFDGSMAFAGAAMAAFTLGTFAEYFVHRAMHWGLLYPEGHRWHHESNDPRTFVRDVFDYGMGAAALSWMGFLVSSSVGFGWMAGALAYTLLASYAHQLQHANPDLVFWMKRPVHRLHHEGGHVAGNYGILVDWWDRCLAATCRSSAGRRCRRAVSGSRPISRYRGGDVRPSRAALDRACRGCRRPAG